FSRTGDIDLYGHGWDGPTARVGPWYVPGTFGMMRMPGTIQRASRKLVRSWQRFVPDPRLVAARTVYKGFAQSKSETLGNYTFAVCFENSVLSGWITEKIFDCFFAGTIPVYWGAPDVQDHIPADCFVDRRRFSDSADLARFLKSLGQREIQSYRRSARDFVESSS